ncbi:MAG TPA: HlyC/CorC family transporter [Candidatus Scybalocola faecipullorum]|nr:HlyC/CorC family transporter [Candidatus Scybalocola faecipullorum]
MDPNAAPQLIVLVILVILSAFFSSAETALTTMNKLRLRTLMEEGSKNAAIAMKLVQNPGKLLSTILIGNNIVNLSASSLSTVFATNLCIQAGTPIPVSTAVGIATGVITLVVLLFGEILPKTLATRYSEKLSLAYARIIYALTIILTPLIFIVNLLSSGVLKLLRADKKVKTQMTENELLTFIDVSHEQGVIEQEEHEMITNVVDFGDSMAKDVMVPRIDIVFASVDSTYEELTQLFKEEKYSRIPVYETSKDNVIGIVNLKDLFCYDKDPKDFVLRNFLREPFYTYEYQKTSELMLKMKDQSFNIAIVLDEYGATAGLITLEDLLEEIVGEIRDEYDDEEDDIQKVSDDEYIVTGSAKLDDINDILGTAFESDDYDSIAGHLINELEHIPTEGESIDLNGYRFRIDRMDKNRIDQIHVYRIDPLPKENSDEQFK